MKTKVTLSLDKKAVEKAKEYPGVQRKVFHH